MNEQEIVNNLQKVLDDLDKVKNDQVSYPRSIIYTLINEFRNRLASNAGKTKLAEIKEALDNTLAVRDVLSDFLAENDDLRLYANGDRSARFNEYDKHAIQTLVDRLEDILADE